MSEDTEDMKFGLSEKDRLKIEEEVKQQLDKENKKKIADEYRAHLIAEAKKKVLLSDADANGDSSEKGLVPIYIDLPAVSDCIRIDGKAYYPNRTYKVTPERYADIAEMMHRGREHEDSLNGKTAKENVFRKKGKAKVTQQ